MSTAGGLGLGSVSSPRTPGGGGLHRAPGFHNTAAGKENTASFSLALWLLLPRDTSSAQRSLTKASGEAGGEEVQSVMFQEPVGDSTCADGHHFLTLCPWVRHLTPLSLFPHVHNEDDTI